ncbi:MAG: flagellar motor protein [Chloroflexi bacterium]|nr:flagellar motor protein [Chloroflexota bacterium]
MGPTTIIGLIVGIGALVATIVLEGGELSRFLSVSAALIVFGGTFGATLTSFPLGTVAKLPVLILKAMLGGGTGTSSTELVTTFVSLAERARREGLLSLEEEANKIKDTFIRKGMLLVVDGIDSEVVRTLLDIEIGALAERHQKSYAMLEAMGGYSPTMGIIGTVMGLVNVLSSLENPSELGSAIATAFIATFYGVGTANLVWLPLGAKLKAQSKEELYLREVAREGILAVQAGDNPRIVREKLEAFLSASERGKKEGQASAVRGTRSVAEEPATAAS